MKHTSTPSDHLLNSLRSVVTLFCFLLPTMVTINAQGERPNIILIFMDDMGHNDIGVNAYPSPGNPYPDAGPAPALTGDFIPEPNLALNLTPAIDRLAGEGLHMTNFYSTSICSPSRAMLLSGRYARRSDIYRVFFPVQKMDSIRERSPSRRNCAKRVITPPWWVNGTLAIIGKRRSPFR
jgi:hypothetical protein